MKKVISSLFFTLLGISLMAQTPVKIKLNLEKGKVHSIKTTSKQAIQQTANGQTFAMDITTNTFVSYKVLKQENEIMDIEFKFDTIATKISSVMFNKETNSAKPGSTDPVEKIMNKMSKYKIVAKISTAGKFIDFVNYGKYKDSIMFVLDSIPATKRDQAKTQAEGLLKESALKSMIEPLFAYLPETSVKTGDTWETSYLLSASGMSMLTQNSYTLKGLDNTQATIAGKSEIESMPSTDPSAKTVTELKGTMTSEGTIDLVTGLNLINTVKGHIEGSLTMKNNGTDMKMPMVVDSSSETRMIK